MHSKYIPNQHGAWAMLIMPFLFGTFAADARPLHALLFVCWLIIYLFTFPLLQLIRTRKSKLFLRPIQIYGGLLVIAGVPLIILKPALLFVGLAYVPLFLVNVFYAKSNNERSFVNDLVAVVQFCSMVYVTYWIGGGSDWSLASDLFFICLLYFIGAVFYVKTMIREKKNKVFYILSVGYHAISLIAFGILFPMMLMIPMLILLARAVIYPKLKLSIKQVGISEIVFSILFSIFVLVMYS